MFPLLASGAGEASGANPLIILPFAILLLLIAAGPLLPGDWWRQNHPWVSAGLGLLTVCYYFFGLHQGGRFVPVFQEYAGFITLIGSLFVVSGGIHINVKGESHPWTNVLFLLCGALAANLIGTTGASMLLIRPWIRMNRYRITGFHTVIFIFLVGNVGGCLTPVGDPPLFLGYLRGVPFWWTLKHCWPAWTVATVLLLVVFYIADSINIRKAPTEIMERQTEHEQWRFDGGRNLVFLVLILVAVLHNKDLPFPVPEAIMILAAAASFYVTPQYVHKANAFTFAPIREVAWLFLGIFATMVPAVDYLGTHAAGIGITSPVQFYFATGTLSSVLDNAPTYLTFLSAAMGLHHLDINKSADVAEAARTFPLEILAISLGAVFFGAMTYIGNGPNLMVKSIADHAKVRTPHFLAYIFRYSLPLLLPILVLVGMLFFSPWRIF